MRVIISREGAITLIGGPRSRRRVKGKEEKVINRKEESPWYNKLYTSVLRPYSR